MLSKNIAECNSFAITWQQNIHNSIVKCRRHRRTYKL
nr:MAG TPA: hypothetical protein [Caudoviricetes sp.]